MVSQEIEDRITIGIKQGTRRFLNIVEDIATKEKGRANKSMVDFQKLEDEAKYQKRILGLI
jgi:hypothetical protein